MRWTPRRCETRTSPIECSPAGSVVRCSTKSSRAAAKPSCQKSRGLSGQGTRRQSAMDAASGSAPSRSLTTGAVNPCVSCAKSGNFRWRFQVLAHFSPRADQRAGFRHVMGDRSAQLLEVKAGHRCIHMMFEMPVHVPVQELRHGIERDGTDALPEVGDVASQAAMHGHADEVPQPVGKEDRPGNENRHDGLSDATIGKTITAACRNSTLRAHLTAFIRSSMCPS